MSFTPIDHILWALSTSGQVLLFAVLIRKRLHRTFPIFLLYLLYSSLSDITFFAVESHVSPRSFLVAYLANSVPEILLQIAILLEVGRNILNPVKGSLPKGSIYVLIGMLVSGSLVALFLSIQSQPADLDRWSQYLLHVNFAAAVLRMAIFSAIAIFSQMLGIGWRNHVFQIAAGFLAYSVVVLLVELTHRFGGVADDFQYHLIEQLRIVCWCMSLGYWSYALVKNESPRREFSPKMARFLQLIAETPNHHGTLSAPTYRK